MSERIQRLPSRSACIALALVLGAINLIAFTQPRPPITPLSPDAAPVHLLDINTADGGALQLLPGIGPKRAQAIIDERVANGPFDSTKDLQRVHGIGPRTAERIAPYIRFSLQTD